MQFLKRDEAASLIQSVTRSRAPVAVLVMACAGLFGGCSANLDQGLGDKLPAPSYLSKAAEELTSVATPGNTAYKIGPQDVLDISVYKVPELSRTVQVADLGSVNLPLVGEVPVAGKTAQEFERDLTANLGQKYLQSPQVTVIVKEYNSQRVTFEGAVKKPGVYPIRGKTTLLQLVAEAGGLDGTSDSSNIVVFRRQDGKRLAARFDIGDLRSGQGEDPELYPGDVVVANASQFKTMFTEFSKALPVAGFFLPFL